MFFKFPYTDMYALNLDYILTKIKEFEEFVGTAGTLVFTVNGRHGDVIITKEEITEIVGGIVNSINGKSGEVTLSPDDIRALVGDYVIRFNNRTGDITLRADDVTATRINAVWVSDSGDVIEDLTQDDLNEMFNSGKRILLFYNSAGIPDRVYFLTLENDIPTPILYSPAELDTGVSSVNGKTGIVSIYSTDIKMDGTAGSKTIAEEFEALKQRDILHSEAILALQDSDTAQDTAITAIQQKDTAQDTAITALQQKDTAQDTAITALQQKDTAQDTTIAAIQSDIGELEQVFIGATSTANGEKGLVPAPTNTQIAQYLKATGNFETVAAGEVSSAAVSGAGTVEAALTSLKSGLDGLTDYILYTSPASVGENITIGRFICLYFPKLKIVYYEGRFSCSAFLPSNTESFRLPAEVPSPIIGSMHFDFLMNTAQQITYTQFHNGKSIHTYGDIPSGTSAGFRNFYFCA